MGASIVSGCDAPPALDPAKHALDPVTLPVKSLVMFDGLLAAFPGWNAGRNTIFYQCIAEPIRIVTAIAQQVFGLGKAFEQLASASIVAGQAVKSHEVVHLVWGTSAP